MKMSLRYLLTLLKPQVSASILLRYASNEKKVVVFDSFAHVAEKNKQSYLDMVKMFQNNDIRRRGYVEFIYAALKSMKEFGVHKDIEVYKSLLEVFPKGRLIPTNIFQAEFQHYPKQQQCAVDLLEQMEDFGVMPDFEMEDILMTVFGRRGIPLRKYWRMMYWMPKFRNLSPWRLPHNMPTDPQELARLAIERISSVDTTTKIDLYRTSDVEASIDDTWIISAQSPIQLRLMSEEAALWEGHESQIRNQMADQTEGLTDGLEPLVVRGAFQVHLRDQLVSYFMLTGAVRQKVLEKKDLDDVSNLQLPNQFGMSDLPALQPSVHEQDDGTIFALCATGTSSRDSLLSWIRLLEKNGNPGLSKIPVVFTLTSPAQDLVTQDDKEDRTAVKE